MAAELQTIASFSDPVEAELVASRLDEEGITADVIGDLTNNAFSGLGYTAGRIDILVPTAELERARAVLAEFAKEIDARKHRPPHAITAEPPEKNLEEAPKPAGSSTDETDREVEKAFRAMLFGVLIPFILPVAHLYALMLLLQVALSGQGMRLVSSIKHLLTLGVSVLGVLLSLFVFVVGLFESPMVLLAAFGPSILLFLFMVFWPGPRAAGKPSPAAEE